MLSSIRNNRKALSIVLWLVIIAFVATIFVVWGVGEKSSSASYIAKVGDKVITINEFNTQNRMIEDELRRFGGDNIAIDNISTYVLQGMVADKVLLLEAERLKIPVTNYELISFINSRPAFQVNNVFNMQQYEMVLRSNNLTPAAFEKMQTEELKVLKLKTLIEQSQSIVSEKEIENEFNYLFSNIKLDYAAIPLKTFENIKVNPTDDELKAYYDIIKEAYRVPAEIKLKYVSYNSDKYLEKFQVSDDDALNYYNNNKSLYSQSEGAEASMIIIPITANDNATINAAKEKADKAYAELEAGKSFAEVANNYADGSLMKKDGYMGIVNKGNLNFEIEQIIFSTPNNTYSKPTKTSTGYVIVYIHDLIPAKEYTFDEKKAEIKAEIKASAGNNFFDQYTMKEYKQILDNTNITNYAKSNQDFAGKVVSSDKFINEKDDFFIPGVKEELFKLDKGSVSKRVNSDNVTYIFEIADKKPSYIPELAQIKEQVLTDYKVDKYTKEGIKALESDIAGTGFQKTVAKYNAEVKHLSFPRNAVDLESVFKGNMDLINEVKSTKSGSVLPKPYLLDNNFYIFKVAEIEKPKKEDMANYKDTIQNSLAALKGSTAIENFVKKSMETIKVKYNKEILNMMNINIETK